MTRRPPAELGEVIGGYRLDELLSRGGMGTVYKATHAVLGRTAVVKVLERSLAVDEDYVARFLEEAKIVNGVRHENIVDIFDFVTTENPRRIACIMEYIHGPTLKGALSQRAFTVSQAVNATVQLIGALRAVHQRGVIHRDLKPTNIMVVAPLDSDLSRRPSLKILDFGIAKVVDSNIVKTGPGTMLGTPAYMAPEQVSGDEITPGTDVYAVGELFYEMVSASRLYATGSANQIIRAKVLGEAPPIRLPVHVIDPDAIRNLVQRCLDAQPSRRPTLDELERDLVAIREVNADTAPESVLLMDDGGRTAVRKLVEASSSPPPLQAPEAPPMWPVQGDQGGQAGGEAPPKPEIRRLGEYYLFAELPARGMTQVFVARKEGRLEICILKRLLHNLEDNPTAIARFGREAKIAQHLDHPRIAKLLDASVQSSTFCIATEFIIGETLDLILERVADSGKTIPLQIVAPLALGILDGMDHAHTARDASGRPLDIIHRDLTPASIVVAFAGDVKIRDFGVARASVDDFKTAPGMAVGSIEYMSPEQARSLPLDPRSDIYTFSAVLYELLSNRPVVRASGVLETLKSVTGDRPPPLISVRNDLTKELASVVEKGLEKDPARRWQSAAEYRDALASALGRLASASLDSAGDFLRRLMPNEEQRAIELLGQIRALGEQIPAPRNMSLPPRSAALDELAPPNEPTMTVRRRTLAIGSEEIEPSVMTMPGAPAPLERAHAPVRVHSIVPVPPKKKPWVAIGAGGAAIMLVMAALVATTRTPPEPMTLESPIESPPSVTVAPKEVAFVEPAPVEAPHVETPHVETPVEPTISKKSPPKAPPVTKALAKAPPKDPPPPPPPPPERAPESGGLSTVKALSKELSLLRANPKDAKLFDKIHREITQASSELPVSGRRRVKVDLDAAERTYDVELLASALNKMALEAAKNREQP